MQCVMRVYAYWLSGNLQEIKPFLLMMPWAFAETLNGQAVAGTGSWGFILKVIGSLWRLLGAIIRCILENPFSGRGDLKWGVLVGTN